MRNDAAGPMAVGAAESERARAFRRLAETRLYESYKLANAILGNAADSQDAVHDAVVAAWEHWPSLRDQSKFDAWFRKIVVNTCRKRLGRAERRRTTELADQPGPTMPDPTGAVLERDQLSRAMARLKPDDRVLLALRYYRDLKLEDVADLLDIPTGTVKSRLNKAHKKLRAALDADLRGGTGA